MQSIFRNFFAYDDNGVYSAIRNGIPIGGYYEPSGLTANVWSRLMWQHNATKHTEDNKLTIAALRADVLDLDGWKLSIVQNNFHNKYIIREYDSSNNIVTLHPKIENFDNLPSSLAVVIYPQNILPFCINYSADATDTLDIGITKEDASTPTTIKKYVSLKPGDTLILPTDILDSIFIRFTSITGGANNHIAWGEFHIV